MNEAPVRGWSRIIVEDNRKEERMSLLYINEDGAVIGVDGNRITVKYSNGLLKSLPIETVDNITILGQSQLTTQCIKSCLEKGIPVTFFSKGGKYFGRLHSTGHVNVALQRKQSFLYENEFALQLSKRLISTKLRNQLVVLKRYEKSTGADVSGQIRMMHICRLKVLESKEIPELMGYEGQGAKEYFDGLAEVIEPDFKFKGRTRRPPLDEFNSMLSLGYSILMNELYAAIERKGLNPYFGFLHRDKEKHPTLASDLMEEWRAVIVDSVTMSLINGHEIQKTDFLINIDEPGCYLTRNGLKIFLNKLNNKLQTKMRYLNYVEYPVSFRQGIALQLDMLARAIEAGNASFYNPIEIR